MNYEEDYRQYFYYLKDKEKDLIVSFLNDNKRQYINKFVQFVVHLLGLLILLFIFLFLIEYILGFPLDLGEF